MTILLSATPAGRRRAPYSKAWCWRTGQIGIGARSKAAPRGTITFATGPSRRLREVVEVLSRHAYDGKTLLVPGIPEATDERAAEKALGTFALLVRSRLGAMRQPEGRP